MSKITRNRFKNKNQMSRCTHTFYNYLQNSLRYIFIHLVKLNKMLNYDVNYIS